MFRPKQFQFREGILIQQAQRPNGFQLGIPDQQVYLDERPKHLPKDMQGAYWGDKRTTLPLLVRAVDPLGGCPNVAKHL
jgi:hypothetical protein